jgi:hypothetical protein
VIFQFVRGTEESLTRTNPTFRDGQPVFERDTNRLKVGDGFTPYRDLPYLGGTVSGGTDDASLAAHISSATPHPVYDDGPSLLLLYNNAKV